MNNKSGWRGLNGGVLVFALAFSLKPTGVTHASVDSSQSDSGETQRVGTLAELRPSTVGERLRADHFNTDGTKITGPGSRSIVSHIDTVPAPTLPTLPPATANVLGLSRDSVCRSAAVFIGRPVTRKALLNTNETFLFTDYILAVDEAIRPIPGNQTSLAASALGGEVLLNDSPLIATILALPRVQKRYVFFLRELPKGAGYALEPPPREVIGLYSASVGQPRDRVDPMVEAVRKFAASCGKES